MSDTRQGDMERCPRCDGDGYLFGVTCRLCAGLGRVDVLVACEYIFGFERERLEAEHEASTSTDGRR